MITENTAVTAQLVTDRRVGFFSFIGSPAVGWMLRSRLAPPILRPWACPSKFAQANEGGLRMASQVSPRAILLEGVRSVGAVK
jgi:hypothetical protein